MSDIHEKLAKLRDLYPDDVEQIEREQERVIQLLRDQEYFLNPMTQQLIALCRKDIVDARVKLATDRRLSEGARTELWLIIDARDWFLKMVAKDHDTELAQIESELEAELHR